MKFSNGCWLQAEGVEAFAPKQAYFIDIAETEVNICAPTNRIEGRGDVLGGINLNIRITSPAPDVFRIQVVHHLGTSQKGPFFQLESASDVGLETSQTDAVLAIKSGGLTLEIDKNDWSMIYKREGEIITTSTGKDLALMKTNWKGLAYDKKGDTADTYMRQCLSLSVGELVYGLGEHFSPLVRNGQTIDMWNEDGGTSTLQAYKNIPFYVTNRGYGIFVNNTGKVSFEVASEYVSKVQFSVGGGALDYYIFNGPSMKQVIQRYTDLTGKPSLPAPWTFGLWLSTSFTTNYDEETVTSFIDGMHERGIPLRTFHFDPYWMKEFHWTSFLWDDRIFPDPKGMLSRIKSRGVNICLWINPYIGQESRLFKEGMEKGYFIKRTNGDVWQWDMWQPGMAIVDFSNPMACKWFQGYLGELVDMGVDCFKTDFGERIPTEDVVFYDGSDPLKMHNYYTTLYNKCVYELLEQKLGKGKAVLFARSATAGGQKYPVHWGGDCWSDYVSMEESIRGGLSFLMSGFGYWAHDIGGFESKSTADVYKRWLAFGLLSSHSRLHGSSSYRVPWLYDEEAVDVCRTFTRLKARLMPYLWKTAIDTSRTGIPMMRSMALEFPMDKNCAYLDKQYMLGDALLVAPVFNDDSMAEYYLPDGTWIDFYTHESKVGGRWYAEKCDYLHIPLMVRAGSIVGIGASEAGPEYDYAENVELRAYGMADMMTASTTVYDMEQDVSINVEIAINNGEITVKSNSSKTYSVRVVGMKLKGTNQGKLTVADADTIVSIE